MSWSGLIVPRKAGEVLVRGAGEILLVVTPILLPVHTQPRMSAHDLCWPGTVSQLLSIPECPSTPARRGELWGGRAPPLSFFFSLSLSWVSLSFSILLDDNSASLPRYDSLMEGF